VLEQAWNQGIKPILVLNKIDRLIMEKKLEPADAYTHINQVLEQVNWSCLVRPKVFHIYTDLDLFKHI
jgi:translation elongation factor EF-G